MEHVPVDAKLDLNQTFVIQVCAFTIRKCDNMNNSLAYQQCFQTVPANKHKLSREMGKRNQNIQHV